MAYYNNRFRRPANSAQKPAQRAANPTIPAQYTQVHADLMAYNGTFAFLLDLRSKFLKYGNLSDKQWESAKKCLTTKTAPIVDKSNVLVPYCNIPITITAYQARKVAKDHNWPFNPCTLRVTSINWVDRKYMSLKVKIDWTGNVTSCRCCGKALSDWRSQATGVGPVCVKGTGIPYIKSQTEVAAFQKKMEDLCDKLGEVTIEISKWAFDSGLPEIEKVITLTNPAPPVPATPQPAVVAPVLTASPETPYVIAIDACQYNPAYKLFTTEVGDDLFVDKREGRVPTWIQIANAKTGNIEAFMYDSYQMSRGYIYKSPNYELNIRLK